MSASRAGPERGEPLRSEEACSIQEGPSGGRSGRIAGRSRLRRIPPLVLLGLVIASLLVADRVGAALLHHAVTMSNSRLSMVYAGRAGADVLVLGNSVADAMLNAPDVATRTGRSVFTMAIHGLDAETQLAFVRAHLRNNKAPAHAILEARTVADIPVAARDHAMFFRLSPELLDLAERETGAILPWRRILTLANFNSRHLMTVLVRIVTRPNQQTAFGGGVINAAMKETYRRTRKPPKVSDRALAAFLETVAAFRRAGVRVHVVAGPLHSVTRETDAVARFVATVAAALPPGTGFLDATTMFEEDRYFEDPLHLNDTGRAAFLDRLATLVGAD